MILELKKRKVDWSGTSDMKQTSQLTYFVNKGMIARPDTDANKDAIAKSFGTKSSDGQSFGFWGDGYKNVPVNPNSSVNDAIPKPEDFLGFPFRHISSTIVGAHSWKATEFSDKVLKPATKLLRHKPVYVNHELEIGNNVGLVGDVKFTPSFKMADGTVVPGGLDAPVIIDARLHTDLCRKLNAFPVPHIQSVSITVTFEWEPSHEFVNRDGNVDEWMFENRIGQEVDGEMVRRVVTKITDIYESSLVWLGADPFAKVLDEKGQPINVEKASVVSNAKFDKDPLVKFYKEGRRYFIAEDCMDDENMLSLQQRVIEDYQKTEIKNQNQKEKTMKDLQALIAETLGIEPEKVTTEFLKGYEFVTKDVYKDVNAKAEKVEQLQKDHDELKSSNDTMKAELATANDIVSVLKGETDDAPDVTVELATSIKKMSDYGTQVVAGKRTECERLYKIAVGEDKVDDAVVELIKGADEKAIDGLLKQYGKDSAEKFGGKCTKCGSDDISYRSTQDTDDDGEDEKTSPNIDMPGAFRGL